MSTFDGRTKEYPALAIDYFVPNSYAKYFVLSHVHKDHTRGLEKLEFKEKLYCSEQTAQLLPVMETRASKQLMYSHLKDCLIPVPYYEPIAMETNEHSTIKLTFLPANHCPGASLILVEGENGTILYTGDMRAEPDFVNTHLSCLKQFRIKNLYMDTTCCHEDRRNFITKKQSTDLLIKLVKEYPNNYHVYLDCWTVGYEEMWLSITEHFGQKIHVSQQRYNMFCHLNPIYDDVLTTDATATRFHSCRWDQECATHEEYMVSIHPTPNRNIKPFQYIRSKQSRQLLQTDLPYHCKPYQQMILPFSTHSSLMEIVFFHGFVNPRQFTPCVARGGWGVLHEMKALLMREGCRLDTTSSSSEIEWANQTSSSSSSDGSLIFRRGSDGHTTSSNSSDNYSSTCGSQTLSWPLGLSPHTDISGNNNNGPLGDIVNNNDNNIQNNITPAQRSLSNTSHISNNNIPAQQSLSSLNELSNNNNNHTVHIHRYTSSLHEISNHSYNIPVHATLSKTSSYLHDQPVNTSFISDPNVIVLSMTDSICSFSPDESFSVHNSLQEKENQLIISDDDDDHEGLCITKENSRKFIKKLKALQKGRRRNKGIGTQNKPICL